MNKLKLLLSFGGESTEHEVSVDSAKYIHSILKDDLYDITLCYVDRDGLWWHLDDFDDKTHIRKFVFSLGTRVISDSSGWHTSPDVIFPVMLGPNGEDGSVQGFAQLLHIPIVGCDVASSAICMNKELTKKLLQEAGIKVVDYIAYKKGNTLPNFDEVVSLLGENVFVKPSNQGSSIGVTRINSAEQLRKSIELAMQYGDTVLIEKRITGIEVGCGVIGNESPEISVVSKIDLGENDFFTYDAKYASNSSVRMIIPADLPDDLTEKVRDVAKQAYKALRCAGFARMDMFLESDGTVLVNEVNTIPAFRSDSSYPKLWKSSGLDPSDLLDKIIKYSLDK